MNILYEDFINPLDGFDDLEDYAFAFARGMKMDFITGNFRRPIGKILCRRKELGFDFTMNGGYVVDFDGDVRRVAQKVSDLYRQGAAPFAVVFATLISNNAIGIYMMSGTLEHPIIIESKRGEGIVMKSEEEPLPLNLAPILRALYSF